MNKNIKNTAVHAEHQNKVKVKCPYCGYEMPIFCGDKARAEDLHVRCKARHCKKFFEIRIEN